MKNKHTPAARAAISSKRNVVKSCYRALPLLAGFCLLNLGTHNAGAVGASMPFTSVEAESGTLAGGATLRSFSTPTNSDSSAQLEASGHAYVQLNATGQSVSLQNNTGGNITALNVRYSIPDAPSGGGTTATLNVYVNGSFRQTINLNSKQTWCYQKTGSEHGWSKDPTYGKPHIFWDEAHFFISSPAVPAGATVTFQKDSGNTASFYWLDVVDMENPPAALSQPANSLPITSYGAVANNPSFDSTTAIKNCISDAQAQGKIVWVPQGTFYLNGSSGSIGVATGITIAGAGMWYSTIYANPTLPASPSNIMEPHSCTVQNLSFDSNAIGAGSGQGNGGGLNVKGSNWVVDNCWIQHLGAGVWANGVNGIVKNCRIGCSWADGINVNNGNGASGNNTGNFLTISNCFVRGTGDDALALNSGNSPGCVQMTNTACISCTSVAPWWANNLGIYGGVNILATNNLCTDSGGAYGISVGVFGDTGLPLQSGKVVNNTVLRGGSYGWYNQNGVPAMNVGTTHSISNITVAANVINDAIFVGVGMELCGPNVAVQDNLVSSPGTTGFLVLSDASGSAQVQYNSAQNIKSGQSAFLNNASGTFTANQNGNSWQSFTKKLVPGTIVTLKAVANNQYVTAANSTTSLIANSASAGTAQSFQVVDAGSGNIGLVAQVNSDYVCADGGGNSPLIANRTSLGPWETYTELDAGSGNTALRAMANNEIVCADNTGTSPLIANRYSAGSWESFTVAAVSSGVTFYQDTGYGGTAGQPLAVGTYTTAQLAAKGISNDWASSARIPAGRTVIMYSSDNFTGTSWTLTSDTPNFTTLSPNANDQMSSCKVQ